MHMISSFNIFLHFPKNVPAAKIYKLHIIASVIGWLKPITLFHTLVTYLRFIYNSSCSQWEYVVFKTNNHDDFLGLKQEVLRIILTFCFNVIMSTS